MTVTLTRAASRRAAHRADDPADAVTMPIPVPVAPLRPTSSARGQFGTVVNPAVSRRHVQRAASPARPRALVAVLAASGVLALVAVAVAAYLLGARTTATPVEPAAATSPAASPVAAPAVAVGTPTTEKSGPELTDTSGRKLDDATAEQVHDVFDALQTGDITALHTAYAADGSDQGLDIESHLHDPAVRDHLLDALRARPSHAASSYTYRLAGYTLSFNQAGDLGAGLGSITGPWGAQSDTTTTKASSPTTSTSATHKTATTRAPSRGGYGPGRPIIEADRSSAPDCQGIALDDLPGACVCGGGTGGLNDLCP